MCRDGMDDLDKMNLWILVEKKMTFHDGLCIVDMIAICLYSFLFCTQMWWNVVDNQKL